MPASEWKRRANSIAAGMRGRPFDEVFDALVAVREESATQAVRWMATDEQIAQNARVISVGTTTFRWT